MSETKAVSQGLADAFADAFVKGGGTVTVQQTVPDGATTFADFLAAVAAAPPGLVFFGGEYQVAAALRTAATEAGVTVPLMGGDGINDAEYITGAGPAAEGTYASGVGVPLLTLPGAADFRAAYDAAGYTAAPDRLRAVRLRRSQRRDRRAADTARGQAERFPRGFASRWCAGVQATDTEGISGAIAFDRYGDTRNPRFTLYRVEGTPLGLDPGLAVTRPSVRRARSGRRPRCCPS